MKIKMATFFVGKQDLLTETTYRANFCLIFDNLLKFYSVIFLVLTI